MLIAPAMEQHSYDLLHLTLSLIASDDHNIPATLLEHFQAVITQAKVLAKNPKEVTSPLIPEAVRLALEIQRGGNFSELISGVSDVQSMSQDVANQFLHDVEQRLAADY